MKVDNGITASRCTASVLAAGLALGSLGLVHAAPAGCQVATEVGTWADGANLDSAPGTASDAACFKLCQSMSACNVSVRDPSNGNCFLKAATAAQLLPSLSLYSSYCAAPEGCDVTTDERTWADGADLASYPATASNGACFAKCAALSGCRVSVRDPSNGNCFLKGTDPNSLLVSESLATTYCAAATPGVCKTKTDQNKWAAGDNLDAFAGTLNNQACFAKCAAKAGCRVSVRDPATGNCFLKAASPAELLPSLDLVTTYCEKDQAAVPRPPGGPTVDACAIVIRPLTWAEGPNLNSAAATGSDEACFLLCLAEPGCTVSVRDPSSGNCFLKAIKAADLKSLPKSLSLTATHCPPGNPTLPPIVAPPPLPPTEPPTLIPATPPTLPPATPPTSPPATPPTSPPAGSLGGSCSDPQVNEAAVLTSVVRAAVGLGPYICNETLSARALEWSKTQCKNGQLSHDNLASRCTGFRLGCAENVLYNGDTTASAPNTAVQQWRNSAGHYANMIIPEFTQAGHGYFACDNGRIFWSALYA